MVAMASSQCRIACMRRLQLVGVSRIPLLPDMQEMVEMHMLIVGQFFATGVQKTSRNLLSSGRHGLAPAAREARRICEDLEEVTALLDDVLRGFLILAETPMRRSPVGIGIGRNRHMCVWTVGRTPGRTDALVQIPQ